MKINEIHAPTAGQSHAAGRVGAGVPSDAPNPVQPVTPADLITTDETERLRSSINGGVGMATTERALRLQSLAQAVRSGSYRPSASQLAGEILAQAELDARLASMAA
jgi:hypothetical protein